MSEPKSHQKEKKKQARSSTESEHQPRFSFAAPTDTSPTFSLSATSASEGKPYVFVKDPGNAISTDSVDSGKTKTESHEASRSQQKNTKVARARRSKYDRYAGGSVETSETEPSMLKTESEGATKTIAFGMETADAYSFSPGSRTGSASRGSPFTRRHKRTSARGRGHRIAAPRRYMQSRSNVPGLPPEIWAQILEFSLYDDVARMARVSRAFLHETMPLLKSLYFVSGGAFSTGANQASRFTNGQVEEIVIDCLFEIASDEKESTNFSYVDSRKPSAFINFVAALPSIKNVFFGAGKKESKATILDRLQLDLDSVSGKYVFRQRREAPNLFIKPRQDEMLVTHATLFHNLIDSYRNGRLSQDMSLYGLPSPQTIYVYDFYHEHVSVNARTQIYNGICECFPLEQARSALLDKNDQSSEYSPFATISCVKLDKALRIILQRPGGKDVLAAADPRSLLYIVGSFNAHVIGSGMGEQNYEKHGIGYLDQYLSSLELLVSVGMDPSGFTREEILDVYSEDEYIREQGAPYMIRESVYRLLTRLGFALDASGFCVVPDKDFTDEVSL